jgi:hypothetical protein
MASARPPQHHRRPSLIKLNLLPAEAWRPPITISPFSVTLVVLVLVGAYLLFPFSTLAQQYGWPNIPNLHSLVMQQRAAVSDLEDELEQKQAYLDYLESQIVEATNLRAQISEGEDLLDAMFIDYPVLSASMVTWSGVLREIDRLAPSGVTIISVSQGSDLTIDGTADDVADVWNYANRLEEAELYGERLFSEVAITNWQAAEATPTPTPTPTPTVTPTPTPPVVGSFTIVAKLSIGGSQ